MYVYIQMKLKKLSIKHKMVEKLKKKRVNPQNIEDNDTLKKQNKWNRKSKKQREWSKLNDNSLERKTKQTYLCQCREGEREERRKQEGPREGDGENESDLKGENHK